MGLHRVFGSVHSLVCGSDAGAVFCGCTWLPSIGRIFLQDVLPSVD